MKIIYPFSFLFALLYTREAHSHIVDEIFENIRAIRNGEKIESQTGQEQWPGELGGRSYARYRRLPSGNIFKDQNAVPLECGGTFDVSYSRTIYFKMDSKSSMCHHAFLGSRYGECRVAMFCEGKIKFAQPTESGDGCGTETLTLEDGGVGYMVGCKTFKFREPRHARSNGTDLYIKFKGSSPTACAVFCLEDVTSDQDLKTPKQIISRKSDHGFEIHPSCKCGERRAYAGRVVGGTTANKYEFPWLTGIVWRNYRGYERRPFCGGSLINDKYVVTAAHCFMGSSNIQSYDIQVLLHAHVMDPGVQRGTNRNDPMYSSIPGWNLPLETDRSEKSIRRDIEEIKCHPLFNGKTFDWDVCILKLKQRINLDNKEVAPICLPLIGELLDYKEESMHVVAGWGRPAETAAASARLPQKLDVPFVSHRNCEHYTVPSKRHLCAGYTSGKGDACQGDSGGPLVFNFKPREEKYILTGITSAGQGCARRGRVGLYTDTMEIVQWVYHNTGDGVWCER